MIASIRRVAAGVSVCLTAVAPWANCKAQSLDAATYPSVLGYRTVRVAEGVYAFIPPEERSSFQAGNSVAIVGGDAVLVFDNGNIRSATRRQIAEIRRLTSKPVRLGRELALAPRSHARQRRVSPRLSRRHGDRHVGDARRHPRARADVRRADAELRADRLDDAAAPRDGKAARRQPDAGHRAAELGADDARLRRVHARGGAHDAVGARSRVRRQSHDHARHAACAARAPRARKCGGRRVPLPAGGARAAHRGPRDGALPLSRHGVLRGLDPLARGARGAGRDDHRAGPR